MTEQEARAIFLLSNFETKSIHKIENGYWPSAYTKEKEASPWWLVETIAGLIKIGWRKRVIEISWDNTPIRVEVTEDDVTKDKTLVHASNHAMAVKYMSQLRREYDIHLYNLTRAADLLPINNSKGA